MTKKDAIEWAGDVKTLALTLQTTREAIYSWHTIPRGRQFELAYKSKGCLVPDSEFLKS